MEQKDRTLETILVIGIFLFCQNVEGSHLKKLSPQVYRESNQQPTNNEGLNLNFIIFFLQCPIKKLKSSFFHRLWRAFEKVME
jgi:hypothetical protein